MVDVCFLVDLAARFLTAYHDEYANRVVYEPIAIARNYSRGLLVFDLIASVPLTIVSAEFATAGVLGLCPGEPPRVGYFGVGVGVRQRVSCCLSVECVQQDQTSPRLAVWALRCSVMRRLFAAWKRKYLPRTDFDSCICLPPPVGFFSIYLTPYSLRARPSLTKSRTLSSPTVGCDPLMAALPLRTDAGRAHVQHLKQGDKAGQDAPNAEVDSVYQAAQRGGGEDQPKEHSSRHVQLGQGRITRLDVRHWAFRLCVLS